MKLLSLVPFFDLQLFAEGGDGGTGAGDTGAASAAPAQPQGNPSAVQYGKAEETAPAQEQKDADDRSAKFEAMIKGEYKDLYGEKVKAAVFNRLKANEEIVNRYNQMGPVLEMLGEKYGVDTADVDALTKAIEDDESFYEAEALESGLSVQQVKANRKMQRENAALKAQLQQEATRRQADALLASWNEQGEKVKSVYPGFDLQAELENPTFRDLLRSNVPVQTAFEVLHKDEIIPAAMQITAKQVEQKVVNSIRAGQNRPSEGAMGSQSPVQRKSDVSQLTKADRDEIDRRVARGEKIMF